MRVCKDCKKAHEMVLASMEYVKSLGQRLRWTEEQGGMWKKTAQTHAEECVQLRQQLLHLQDAHASGMLPQLVKERDALRAECDDLRRVFSLVHGSLGIQQGEHIGNAIEALKKERDDLQRTFDSISDLVAERDELRAQLSAERERNKKTEPATRSHPVKVGEWVKRTSFDHSPNTQIGAVAKVLAFDGDGDYRVTINGTVVCWCPSYCTPCDPPTASHDTPEGKETAAGAVTPQPGDVVRLVRACEGWDPIWGRIGDVGTVMRITTYPHGPKGLTIRETGGLDWPLSCVEIVGRAEK